MDLLEVEQWVVFSLYFCEEQFERKTLVREEKKRVVGAYDWAYT
jgi:hypothetical protein